MFVYINVSIPRIAWIKIKSFFLDKFLFKDNLNFFLILKKKTNLSQTAGLWRASLWCLGNLGHLSFALGLFGLSGSGSWCWLLGGGLGFFNVLGGSSITTICWIKDSNKNVFRLEKLFIPDGLFALSLAHFGLLVSLLHDVVQSGAGDGSLKLGQFARFLLDLNLGLALFVLASVQNGPVDSSWITLKVEWRLTFSVDECDGLR